MYLKDFDRWNEVKKRLSSKAIGVYIREGEIRWISIGINIGSEIDGKGASFLRPALILRVIKPYLALVVPLSKRDIKRKGEIPIKLEEISAVLCLHQIRVVSQKRIFRRKGRVSQTKLESISKELVKFYSL